MRASRKGSNFEVPASGGSPGRQSSKVSDTEHISGAEGIYEVAEIEKMASAYIKRALNHPRGMPDRIILTIEKITEKPLLIGSLPVSTLISATPSESAGHAEDILLSAGISVRAVKQAFRILHNARAMRGAALVLSESGKRVEPDRHRGVRVSSLGISKTALRSLSKQLSRQGINTDTVREAIILASKVASCSGIQAEVCISDDPDYTTGYVSSRKTGYVRIPCLKESGDRRGGRVFFLRENADIEKTIACLEQRPAIVSTVSSCGGEISLHEILDNHR